MKPIQIENNQDSAVSIQTIVPMRDGKPLPREIAMMIEDKDGICVAAFTYRQANALIGALHQAMAELAGHSN